MTETKLKPCPFCGGKAEQIEARVDDDTKTYSVICTNCMTGIFRPRMKGMQWCAYKTEQEAIESWNKRVVQNELPIQNAKKSFVEMQKNQS